MEINVSGVLREKTSKSGNKYYAVDLKLTDTYTKTVFLEEADVEIVKLFIENKNLKNKGN